jgi:hypothetical protein
MDQKQDETNQKLDETTFQLTIYNQCAWTISLTHTNL